MLEVRMNPESNCRRRAEINGKFAQFFSRTTKIATVRWHSRFKAQYRTEADALKAKDTWEAKERILFPEDMERGWGR
jgi:hypothetical protein